MRRNSILIPIAGATAAAVFSLTAVRAAAGCCAVPTTLAQNEGTSAPSTTDARTVNLSIDGMTCEACSASITTALRNLPGVKSIDIAFARKGGTVAYDPTKVDEKVIVEAINKSGFKAAAIPAAKGQ